MEPTRENGEVTGINSKESLCEIRKEMMYLYVFILSGINTNAQLYNIPHSIHTKTIYVMFHINT